MSKKDVAAALHGFETFKAIVDVAEGIESFAGSATDVVEGAVSIDTALNIFTTGVGAATNTFDPGATLEDSVVDLLKEVIRRVDLFHEAGEYSMSCPLGRFHVSCTPTETCAGGYWVPGKPQFLITYGGIVRTDTKGAIPYDIVMPAEAPHVITRLRNRFSQANDPALRQIRAAEKACAGGH
jgi:hypothetical protein